MTNEIDIVIGAWKQVKDDCEVRQNLSKIRQEIKNKQKLELFREEVAGDNQQFIDLLSSKDAKTRKNAALLMGDLGMNEFLAPIFMAYEKEEQRFIKSAYLSAIGKFDYKEYVPKFKESLCELAGIGTTAENEKHVTEEMRELTALIVRMEGVKAHRFTGWNQPHDVMLLTSRNFTALTKQELLEWQPNAKTKEFGAGVQAKVEDLNWLSQIRTYQEILFVVKGMETSPMDEQQLAKKIAESELLAWLGKNHAGSTPYYFRVELKSKRPLDEKSMFVKKLSTQIERLTERKLTNTTENYEFEIRVIENKEGNCNLLVKLFTLKDERFSYRTGYIPTSIKPVNAALTVALARNYMKEGAQVLDPFCGVGTMLIERYKAVKANTTYGIDFQEEAILKARENTEAAGQIIHYINRDFFRFEHDYLFDEVITNMPFRIGRFTDEEVTEVYKQFFVKIKKHLKEDALLVLYSHNMELVEQFGRRNGFCVFKSYEISKREGTHVLLLRQQIG